MALSVQNYRGVRFGCILFASLLFSGCIYSGTGEAGYFESVVDKSELIEIAGEDGYSFAIGKFYTAHRKSILSSAAGKTTAINYVDTGDERKTAIIFVHGTPGTWEAFWEYLLIAELKKNAHLVSIDRPGWGESVCKTTDGKDCFDPLIKQQSRSLDTLVKRLDEQNNHQGIILVGHSLGGPLIAQMAFDYPEYITGLIFVAAPFDPDLSHPRWYNRLSSALAWFVPRTLRRSNDEMMPLARQLGQMDDVWASLEVPIWVIQGSRDDLVDPRNLDYARMIFAAKNAEFREFEQDGHLIVWERKSVVVESIRKALDDRNSEISRENERDEPVIRSQRL
ncbi:MAG: alpha/beta hydrolase [Gammaproteobacteria bacterium]|nr:alpha/beta hydrolase [Gammaproteobacteria bacterium]